MNGLGLTSLGGAGGFGRRSRAALLGLEIWETTST